MGLTQEKSAKVCGGELKVFSHNSSSTQTPMRFGFFLPPGAQEKVPVLYWLSGLTCTEDNFLAKAGAFRAAAKLGLALVVPDTSPRGANIPGEEDSWDFGTGAGFYVDATQEPWAKNYNMYSYISKELPELVQKNLPIDPERQSISGHSMGGHGAMVIGLRNPGQYKSISAFSPICAPTQCPWGEKAFSGYLGSDRSSWVDYDSSLLLENSSTKLPILVDQGGDDEFKDLQLLPGKLQEAAAKSDYPLEFRLHAGYDHSYYFISTFIDDHIEFHANHLKR
jgi:S-formylglutathione hydrolase